MRSFIKIFLNMVNFYFVVSSIRALVAVSRVLELKRFSKLSITFTYVNYLR